MQRPSLHINTQFQAGGVSPGSPGANLSLDTSFIAKATSPLKALHAGPLSAPIPPSPAGNTSATFRRRRVEHFGFGAATAAFFGQTTEYGTLYNPRTNQKYSLRIIPKVDRGFFLSESDWTCYRRNYFQVSGAFSGAGLENPEIETPCLLQRGESTFNTVLGFAMGVSAKIATGDRKIELIQHTTKRDKGPQLIPQPKPIRAGGNPIQFIGLGQQQAVVTFERLQFKTATANNGKRRAAQQYYCVCIDLYADLDSGDRVKIASVQSAPVVVRGRSPGHYADSKHDSATMLRSAGVGPLLTSNSGGFTPTSATPGGPGGNGDSAGGVVGMSGLIDSLISPTTPSPYTFATDLTGSSAVHNAAALAAAAAVAANNPFGLMHGFMGTAATSAQNLHHLGAPVHHRLGNSGLSPNSTAHTMQLPTPLTTTTMNMPGMPFSSGIQNPISPSQPTSASPVSSFSYSFTHTPSSASVHLPKQQDQVSSPMSASPTGPAASNGSLPSLSLTIPNPATTASAMSASPSSAPISSASPLDHSSFDAIASAVSAFADAHNEFSKNSNAPPALLRNENITLPHHHAPLVPELNMSTAFDMYVAQPTTPVGLSSSSSTTHSGPFGAAALLGPNTPTTDLAHRFGDVSFLA